MLERTSWMLLALIHESPFAAFFKPGLISQLYSVPMDDPSFALFHHRAALFGVVFIACIWAVFDPNVRKLSAVVTALSMVSFLGIFSLYGQPAPLQKIALVDAIGLPILAYAGWKAWTA